MAVTKTGTVYLFGSETSPQNVTVPADAQGAIVFWSGYKSGGSFDLSSVTLNSVSFALLDKVVNGGGSGTSTGSAFLNSAPASGTQSLAWTFTGTPASEGPHIGIIFVKGALSNVEARDSVAEDDGAVTVTSNTGDYTAAMIQAFGSEVNTTGFTVEAASEANNSEAAALVSLTAGASTTTFTMDGGDPFPTIAAVAIYELTLGPTLSTLSPTDNATGVSATANLVLTFTDDVQVGTGDVRIINDDTGATLYTIDITDGGQVTFSGAVVTINPSSALTYSRNFHVEIDDTAIESDPGGDPWAGMLQVQLTMNVNNSADEIVVEGATLEIL